MAPQVCCGDQTQQKDWPPLLNTNNNSSRDSDGSKRGDGRDQRSPGSPRQGSPRQGSPVQGSPRQGSPVQGARAQSPRPPPPPQLQLQQQQQPPPRQFSIHAHPPPQLLYQLAVLGPQGVGMQPVLIPMQQNVPPPHPAAGQVHYYYQPPAYLPVIPMAPAPQAQAAPASPRTPPNQIIRNVDSPPKQMPEHIPAATGRRPGPHYDIMLREELRDRDPAQMFPPSSMPRRPLGYPSHPSHPGMPGRSDYCDRAMNRKTKDMTIKNRRKFKANLTRAFRMDPWFRYEQPVEDAAPAEEQGAAAGSPGAAANAGSPVAASSPVAAPSPIGPQNDSGLSGNSYASTIEQESPPGIRYIDVWETNREFVAKPHAWTYPGQDMVRVTDFYPNIYRNTRVQLVMENPLTGNVHRFAFGTTQDESVMVPRQESCCEIQFDHGLRTFVPVTHVDTWHPTPTAGTLKCGIRVRLRHPFPGCTAHTFSYGTTTSESVEIILVDDYVQVKWDCGPKTWVNLDNITYIDRPGAVEMWRQLPERAEEPGFWKPSTPES